jgi:hypothetical protein
MNENDIIRMALEHFGAVLKPSDLEVKLAALAVAAERKACAIACEKISESLYRHDNVTEGRAAQDCADAIRARGEQLREALKTYGQHRNNCAAVLGGYQCTCGFNQQEQTR